MKKLSATAFRAVWVAQVAWCFQLAFVLSVTSSGFAAGKNGPVMAFVYDYRNGANTAQGGFASSTEADKFAAGWCKSQHIPRESCAILQCLGGWFGVALGYSTDDHGRRTYHYGDSCGSKNAKVAKSMALYRCDVDYTEHCKFISSWYVD